MSGMLVHPPKNQVTMSPYQTILAIGCEETLLKTRTMILQRAGYYVSEAMNEKDALARVEAEAFSLVVLCHTFPEARGRALVKEIKRLQPQLPILHLSNSLDPGKVDIDGVLHSLAAPDELLEMVRLLTVGLRRVHKPPDEQAARPSSGAR